MMTFARRAGRLGLVSGRRWHTAPAAGSKWASSIDDAGRSAAQTPATHSVLNQSTPLCDYNAFSCDPSLVDAIAQHGAKFAEERISALGMCVGSGMWQEQARLANLHRPVLHTHDKQGRQIDKVEYHPAYHQLQNLAIEAGASGFAWEPSHTAKKGAQVARAALMYLMYQLEPGVCCPTTMTYAATPALRAAEVPSVAEAWLPRLRARVYDPRDVPLDQKAGCVVGMSMTEKQGGSDVRSNTTVATPVHAGRAGPGEQYTLIGHKWFTSAPMSDGFLTLAHAEGTADGRPSCFLVPRWLPDGTRNSGLRILRLKDKLGDRSNASSEIEYQKAWGVLIGKPGAGVKTILEMVVHTRLDCTIGSSALMRQCAQLAMDHSSQRSAFGSVLSEQPLMRSVLLDLAVESEAANALWPRLASSFEDHTTDLYGGHQAAFRRIATAVGKYWVCKRAPSVAYEAMECLGGNGYVEGDSSSGGGGLMARLYRQAPLNAIWEGSGNVIALDILRALRTEPGSGHAFLAELKSCHGSDARLDALTATLAESLIAAPEEGAEAAYRWEARARRLVDSMAVGLQAATLIKHGDQACAEAFCASRLPGRDGAGTGWHYGALRSDFGERAAEQAVLDRLAPRVG